MTHSVENAAPITRLSVNINQDCADHLHAMREAGVSATEVIRQAIALHKFVSDGGRLIPPAEQQDTNGSEEDA